MAVIGWGKPTIWIKDLNTSNAKWTKTYKAPAEDSTELSTEKGDKTEAKFEGGENEDVKYGKNTYSLAMKFRIGNADDGAPIIPHSDGVVTNNYAVAVIPEDASVPGVLIEKATVSAEDAWTAADGGSITYTFDALSPTSGSQVKWLVMEEKTTGEGSSAVTEPVYTTSYSGGTPSVISLKSASAGG